MLICFERKIPLVGDWFVLRERYFYLVANKPNENALESRERRRGGW
jgi:hypothetical protein